MKSQAYISLFFFISVRKVAERDCKLRLVRLSTSLSAWNNSVPNGQILMKFDI
jgi:hypothetical protein